jgi:succinate dehydrogenase/fumarate reductase cytochrome b subunit
MISTNAKTSFLFKAKWWHYYSGLTLSVFIAFHLANQLTALAGPEQHIALMKAFRKVYRHPVMETILMTAVFFQVITGFRLLFNKRRKTKAEKVQLYSGLYLSFFLLVHLTAVLYGRYLQLDTNFYYAGVGLNYFPATFFFIPYYFLAVAAISLHIAALHFLRTGSLRGAYVIGIVGILAAAAIIIGFTSAFHWRSVPPAYEAFIRKFF